MDDDEFGALPSPEEVRPKRRVQPGRRSQAIGLASENATTPRAASGLSAAPRSVASTTPASAWRVSSAHMSPAGVELFQHSGSDAVGAGGAPSLRSSLVSSPGPSVDADSAPPSVMLLDFDGNTMDMVPRALLTNESIAGSNMDDYSTPAPRRTLASAAGNATAAAAAAAAAATKTPLSAAAAAAAAKTPLSAARPALPASQDVDAYVFAAALVDVSTGAGGAVEGDVFELARQFQRSVAHRIAQVTTGSRDAAALRAELHTWQLISVLVADRAGTQDQLPTQSLVAAIGSASASDSEKLVLHKALMHHHALRQAQIVLEWLQSIAADDLDVTAQPADWKRTLSALSAPGAKPVRMVTSLDPDAPIRDARALHPDDAAYEASLLRAVWQLVRAGDLSGAQELCRQRGQPWRAASLGGADLHHDPMLCRDEADLADAADDGNPWRSVWRASCRHVARTEGLDPYEQAVYGILAGDLDCVLPVCQTWEDHLWARVKVLVEAAYDAELAAHATSFAEVVPDTASRPAPPAIDLRAALSTLSSSSIAAVRRAAVDPYRVIQSHVIANRRAELLRSAAGFAGRADSSTHLIRMLAHLVIFIHDLAESGGDAAGLSPAEELDGYAVLSAYTNVLIRDGQRDLVALYASRLPPPMQIEAYQRLMRDVRDPETRRRTLDLARESGIDVKAITLHVVQQAGREAASAPASDADALGLSSLSQQDMDTISALQWLCFDAEQCVEAVVEANAIARGFLLRGKQRAVTQLFDTVLPHEAIQSARQHDDNPVAVAAVREHIALRMLLAAHDAFSSWTQVHASPPAAPDLMTEQARESLDAWRVADAVARDAVVEAVRRVLEFPGGWMRDEAVPSPERADQLERLRKHALPDLVFLLHSTLHQSGMYQDALALANLVADERLAVLDAFSSNELGNFMRCLRESALAQLAQCPSGDPLGYYQ